MSETYETFMVYELDDSGDRVRLNVSEDEFKENNGANVLHPSQVVVVVKEGLRRIFIWKGAKSSVRKRFISSRVASSLQDELIKEAAFHRCKIVSVDQGDEVIEFLNAFRFKSMPVEEKLADMRYIRNIDRDKMLDEGIIPDEGPKVVKVEKKEPSYSSPALQEAGSKAKVAQPMPKRSAPVQKQSYQPPARRAYASSQKSNGLSETAATKIKDKILKNDPPKNYRRQNLVLGHTLYGAVSKTTSVFGENIEETEWDRVTKLPKDTIEIDDHKIRIYFDLEKGIVEAIEIFEKEDGSSATATKKKVSQKPTKDIDYNSWTVKELKKYCEDNNMDISSNARKADIIKTIKDSSKSSGRRELPKIPSNND